MSDGRAYELLDSGDGAKLERFGPVILERPSPQALWPRRREPSVWESAHARFTRDREGAGVWTERSPVPEQWVCRVGEQDMLLRTTSFGHVGVFTEQAPFWQWILEQTRRAHARTPRPRILNLFAYTGGSSIASARGGGDVTHCDASKGIVQWASESAALNTFESGAIRWIVDDALKFLAREARRERRYHGIILDPPSFGRGPKGQVFKLEEEIVVLLRSCAEVLADDAQFVLLSAHTPGIGSIALGNLLANALGRDVDDVARGEMVVRGADAVTPLPSGQWSAWFQDGAEPGEVLLA